MTTHQTDALQAVRESIAAALRIEIDEVPAGAALITDLEVDSIDLLDILFHIERALQIELAAADIPHYVQGDVAEDEFYDAAGALTSAARRQLTSVMPQLDLDALPHPVDDGVLMQHFTVANLATMVDGKREETGEMSI